MSTKFVPNIYKNNSTNNSTNNSLSDLIDCEKLYDDCFMKCNNNNNNNSCFICLKLYKQCKKFLKCE